MSAAIAGLASIAASPTVPSKIFLIARPPFWPVDRYVRCVSTVTAQTSWIEVALPADHCRPDALVVDDVDRRTRARSGHEGNTLEGGVALRVEHFDTDIELRDRVPLGTGAHFPEALVWAAAVARTERDRARDLPGDDRGDAAGGQRDRSALQDQVRGIAAVVDVDVAAEPRGAPLRVPDVLVEGQSAPHPGEVDLGA